jgi:hypothetical protein
VVVRLIDEQVDTPPTDPLQQTFDDPFDTPTQ